MKRALAEPAHETSARARTSSPARDAAASASPTAAAQPAARARTLTKDECVALALSWFEAERDGAGWAEPRFALAAEGLPADGYAWRVPTSLFFGLMAARLGSGAEDNAAKRRRELRVRVENLAEAREQTEAFREDVFTGVVLRGESCFGWASSAGVLADLPAALFRRGTEPVPLRAGEAAAGVRRHATELLAALDDGCGHVNGAHRRQLEMAARGEQPHIAAQLERVLAADPTTDFVFCARAYGGGPWRLALTLASVAERLQATSVTVPEQFGDGRYVYSPTDAQSAPTAGNALVGAELRADGSTSYIRLHLADTVPGDTRRCAFKRESGAAGEPRAE